MAAAADPSAYDLVPLNLNEVHKHLPPRRRSRVRTGEAGRLSRATVFRWVHKGIGGVKLKVQYAGSQPFTTARWIREFGAELAAVRAGQQDEMAGLPPHQRRTPAEAQRAHLFAQKRLEAAGIGPAPPPAPDRQRLVAGT